MLSATLNTFSSNDSLADSATSDPILPLPLAELAANLTPVWLGSRWADVSIGSVAGVQSILNDWQSTVPSLKDPVLVLSTLAVALFSVGRRTVADKAWRDEILKVRLLQILILALVAGFDSVLGTCS